MVYPHGATIDYTYQHVAFDPGSALQTTVIATKSVFGPGVAAGQWQFEYAPHSSPFTSDGHTLKYDVTTVTTPDARYRYYHYGKDFIGIVGGQVFIRPTYVGLLAMKEIYNKTNNTLLERRGYSWRDRLISNENFWHGAEYRSWWIEDGTYAPMLDGEGYNRDAGASGSGYAHVRRYLDYDAYGNPGRIYENVNLAGQHGKQTVITYQNDIAQWMLGLPLTEIHQSVTSIDDNSPTAVGSITRTYFSNGLLKKETRYGVPTEYTYTSDGDLSTSTDARGDVRRYLNYKRGIAQREELPESVVLLRLVNSSGTLRSETNGRNFTIAYTYDDLNRLTSIDYPLGADVAIVYDPAGDGYSRMLTRGNYRQTDVINDFGEVRRTERVDLQSGETIYRTVNVDALGREIFSSYPNATIGLTTTHDPLGRIKRTTHPDATYVEYSYADHQVSVRNERANTTTYLYRIFGIDEADQQLYLTTQPLDVLTLVERDLLGNPTRVIQGRSQTNGSILGYAKLYEYDSHKFLTRSVEPEVGTTVFTHDQVGNVLTQTVNHEPATAFQWDGLRRRVAVDYGDSTPDVHTVFDKSSNIIEVTKGRSRWNYSYDDNDNPLTETLNVTDFWFGPRTYTLAYTHSPLDVVSSITYPSGLVVDYAPDAFGRATRAGTFATNVLYYPSGQLRSYTLANGLTTEITLNQRLLTDRVRTGSVVDLSYAYDSGANVQSVTDAVTPAQSVTSNSYDALDRLTAAGGAWGQDYYQYDRHGNFSLKRSQADSFKYSLDARQRVTQLDKFQTTTPAVANDVTQFDYDSRGNMVAKRFYNLYQGGAQGYVAIRDSRQRFDAASHLVGISVVNTTTQNANGKRAYEYDGNGMRFADRDLNAYRVSHAVYAKSGALLYEDSIGECARTDHIRLGSLVIAKSTDTYGAPATDSDADGMNDCLETQLGLNPQSAADATADLDGDGLSNRDEILAGASVRFVDTDGDGISDLDERNVHHTDVLAADTDGDGISDQDESADPRLSASAADSDHDGVSDDWELSLQTDPSNPLDAYADFDADGFSNRQERWLDLDPMLLAQSPARGTLAWRQDVVGPVNSVSPVTANGTVYVSANGRNSGAGLYAINPDGTVKWKYEQLGATMGPPTVGADGTVYAAIRFSSVQTGSPRSLLIAFNPDGTQRWAYASVSDYLETAVSIGRDGQLMVGGSRNVSSTGVMLTIDRNGNFVRAYVTNRTVTTAAAIGADGSYYIATAGGNVYAFNSDGTLRWTYVMRSASATELSLGHDGTLYAVDQSRYTYALRPNGTLAWEMLYSQQAQRSGVTIGDNGMLYIGATQSASAGKLLVVRASDGQIQWSSEMGSGVLTPSIGSDGTLYAVSYGGRISAFDPSGTQIWTNVTGSLMNAPPAIDRDGTLYVGSLRGQLISIVERGGGLARTPWPMQRHDIAAASYHCFNSDSFSATADTDGDGVNDCDELRYGLDANDPADGALDLDGDGLRNSEEVVAGSRLDLADTDNDALQDGVEVLTYHTNPVLADTDGDSLNDGYEIQYGFNPLNRVDGNMDSDSDGFSNRQEMLAGTDPLNLSSAPSAGDIAVQVNDATFPSRQPAVGADGTIYVNGATTLDALNPDLSVKWRWPERVEGNVAVGGNGLIYAITQLTGNQRRLIALYPNGKLVWSHAFYDRFYGFDGPVIGNDGSVYITHRYYSNPYYRTYVWVKSPYRLGPLSAPFQSVAASTLLVLPAYCQLRGI